MPMMSHSNTPTSFVQGGTMSLHPIWRIFLWIEQWATVEKFLQICGVDADISSHAQLSFGCKYLSSIGMEQMVQRLTKVVMGQRERTDGVGDGAQIGEAARFVAVWIERICWRRLRQWRHLGLGFFLKVFLETCVSVLCGKRKWIIVHIICRFGWDYRLLKIAVHCVMLHVLETRGSYEGRAIVCSLETVHA